MRRITLAIFVMIAGLLTIGAANARVRIDVDLGSQTMHVVSASGNYVWPISSARSGFHTPRGRYGIVRMEAMHRSRKYHNSPMPHSLFFKGGYAIHGTYSVASLGQPASHGCIRLSPQNAAALYQMVKQEGAQIAIDGTAPAPRHYAVAERRDIGLRGTYAVRHEPHVRAYATMGQPRRFAQRVYDADGRGFYLRPVMSYAPQPRGLGEWLMQPDAW